MRPRPRDKAAKLLTALLGVEIDPDDIEVVTGYWKAVDVYRWEFWATPPGTPHRLHFGCWETLTTFVRYGSKFGTYRKDMGAGVHEVGAHEEKQAK